MGNIVSVSYIDVLPEISIKCNSGAASALVEVRGDWRAFVEVKVNKFSMMNFSQ